MVVLRQHPPSTQQAVAYLNSAKITLAIDQQVENGIYLSKTSPEEYYDLTWNVFEYPQDEVINDQLVLVRVPTGETFKDLIEAIESFIAPYFLTIMKLIKNPESAVYFENILEKFDDNGFFDLRPIVEATNFGVAMRACTQGESAREYFEENCPIIGADEMSDRTKEMILEELDEITEDISEVVGQISFYWESIRVGASGVFGGLIRGLFFLFLYRTQVFRVNPLPPSESSPG